MTLILCPNPQCVHHQMSLDVIWAFRWFRVCQDKSLTDGLLQSPHVSMGRTGHIYIYAREMGPLWLTRKRADRPTLKLEFHQQRKEENYFWGGNRVPGLPRWFSGKESTSQCRRRRFYLLFRKISCRRKWQPLQYSYQENPMDRGTWQAIVHGVTKESDKT